MIFALTTDDRTLLVFATEAEAIACAEGIDVEDGNWLFFDADGKPLEAVFTTPNKHGSFWVESGVYVLRLAASAFRKTLLDELDDVSAVEGEPPLNTVAEIKKLLTLRSTSLPSVAGRR